MTVDWDVLDDFMLRRHWAGGRAQERAALPDLADRILIFHRGVDMVSCWDLSRVCVRVLAEGEALLAR